MEQTVTDISLGGNSLHNSLVKPTIVKDVTILAPGIWTGDDGVPTEYTAEQIRNGFENSDWENMNLFLDHKDTKGSAVADWIGFARNVRLADGGEILGDLEIWHPLISLFIKQAKAKFGVSATMGGHEEFDISGGPSRYKLNSFKSISLVDDPGCKVSWLPKMLSSREKGDKKVIGGFVDQEKIKSLSKVDTLKKEIVNSNLDNCKEVKNMTEKNLETKKDVDAKSLADKSVEEVKNLHSKIDKLTDVVTGLSETLKTLSAEKVDDTDVKSTTEETKVDEGKVETDVVDETKVEVTEDNSEVKKELNSTKEKLEEVTKELAALKKEANSPDRKTLASPVGNIDNASTHSANADMLGFLRESSNIPIY